VTGVQKGAVFNTFHGGFCSSFLGGDNLYLKECIRSNRKGLVLGILLGVYGTYVVVDITADKESILVTRIKLLDDTSCDKPVKL
jgi:hypothetical protein